MKTVRTLTTTARALAKVSRNYGELLVIVELLIGCRLLDSAYAVHKRALIRVLDCTTDCAGVRRYIEEECALLEAQEDEEFHGLDRVRSARDAEPVRHGRLR